MQQPDREREAYLHFMIQPTGQTLTANADSQKIWIHRIFCKAGAWLADLGHDSLSEFLRFIIFAFVNLTLTET